MNIPRKIIMKKLTEFVAECKNEDALNYFVKELIHATDASWLNKETITLKLADRTSHEFSPRELVSYILDRVDQSVIRNNVAYVKGEFNYKLTK